MTRGRPDASKSYVRHQLYIGLPTPLCTRFGLAFGKMPACDFD